MVGEIRDRETAEIAIQAALTGHLVMTTLHSNSTTEAIGRLINVITSYSIHYTKLYELIVIVGSLVGIIIIAIILPILTLSMAVS